MNQTDVSAQIQSQDAADFPPFAHVVGDHEEHRGQRRQRDEFCQWRDSETMTSSSVTA